VRMLLHVRAGVRPRLESVTFLIRRCDDVEGDGQLLKDCAPLWGSRG
jgi:hypothetical protein